MGRGAADELREGRCSVYRAGTERRQGGTRDENRLARCARGCDTRRESEGVGIDRAKGIIATLSSDADNLYLVLSAKTLNPKLQISARVLEEEAEAKMRRAGADTVLAPYNITGRGLHRRFCGRTLCNFSTSPRSVSTSVSNRCASPRTANIVSRSLRQMALRKEVGVIVLAIRKSNGEMIFNPDAETEIAGGDV